MPKPMTLIILDGWGHRTQHEDNAIFHAKTPHWDRFWNTYPHTFIKASGAAVGLPADQMGNSEVGHLNLGAGRVVYQEFTRVSRAIKTGSFFNNHTLTDAVDKVISCNQALHIFGLLSPGGVHSHEEHIHAMLKLAIDRGAKRIYIHAFLDGRDTAPKSAQASLDLMEEKIHQYGGGRIASLIGRYYAMDRDSRWTRIEMAYDLLTQGLSEHQYTSATDALSDAYKRGESDEFVKPTSILDDQGQPVHIADGDVIVFMNYRSDRARQITRTFTDPSFDSFERKHVPALNQFVTLTEYNAEFDVPIAFPAERLNNVFGEYISTQGFRQLRIAETEKYAHVTFFFNGGVEQPFEGEDRILIKSPDVATYDLKPEMHAYELTEKLIEAIYSGKYDYIICNYANSDMVGHTGKFDAAVKAIETLDNCLGKLHDALKSVGGEMLITADHGNAEKMHDRETNQPHTAHTTNLVPLIYVGRPAQMSETGSLSDVIPTLLHLSNVKKPTEMAGETLAIETDPLIESLPTKVT
jgi:2,3-bisphosphoglycerate-independent phosphoglycerate mutase